MTHYTEIFEILNETEDPPFYAMRGTPFSLLHFGILRSEMAELQGARLPCLEG
jgi:hypothetical protein